MANNEINNELENEMFKIIRMFETENLKTKKYDDRQAVKMIMNYIKKTVDKKEGYIE